MTMWWRRYGLIATVTACLAVTTVVGHGLAADEPETVAPETVSKEIAQEPARNIESTEERFPGAMDAAQNMVARGECVPVPSNTYQTSRVEAVAVELRIRVIVEPASSNAQVQPWRVECDEHSTVIDIQAYHLAQEGFTPDGPLSAVKK